MPLHLAHWRGWVWHGHFFLWVFPAVQLVLAANAGASGLSIQSARILCWISAVAIQVAFAPQRPWLLTADDDFLRMTVWPFGIWHDARLSNLWRIHRQGISSILISPIANFCVAITCAVVLGFWNIQSSWNPLRLEGPWRLDDSLVETWSIFWWLGQLGHAHWTLTLAALLPALPMTGGQLVALALDHTNWKEAEARTVRRNFALATCILLIVLGCWQAITGHEGGYVVLLLGLIIGIEIRRQARRDAALAFIEAFLTSDLDDDLDDDSDDDLDDDDTFLENQLLGRRDRRGFSTRIRDWFQSRRQAIRTQRIVRQIARESADTKRLDQLLEQIHERGLKSLTWQERRFLRKISERMRNRDNS